MNIYRHGDILIKQIEILPNNLKKVQETKSFVIAEGETTGHKHLLQVLDRTATDFCVYQNEQGNYILDMKSDGKLTHEEHKEITIKKGIYFVGHEQEFSPFDEEIKRVRD
jgi:hypothetical protein